MMIAVADQVDLWKVAEVVLVPVIGFVLKVLWDMSRRVTQLETKMEYFWNGVMEKAGHYLHSPDNHHKLDEFIDISARRPLTELEVQEFLARLHVISVAPSVDNITQFMASVYSLALTCRTNKFMR